MSRFIVAVLTILCFLLAVQPVQAENSLLTGAGAVVLLMGVTTAIIGGHPRQKADRERFEDYSSCYDSYGSNCFEKNYGEGSGVAWDPDGGVIAIGLLLSAAGVIMLAKGLTGPSVAVSPQRDGARVTVSYGW